MRRHLLLASLLCAAVACGGSTDESSTESTSGQGGSAGSSAGGSSAGGSSAGGAAAGGSGVGGASAGGAATGGSSAGGASVGGGSPGGGGGVGPGPGGAAGTGQAGTGQAGTGQAGTGQAGTGQAGAGGECEPPADPTKVAVCVSFAPENVVFVPGDTQLDGKGYLYLAAYDTPFPDKDDPEPDVPPIAAVTFPPLPGGAPPLLDEVGLGELPQLRLDGLPPTVYLRAFFFDNLDALAQKQISWGVWLGGLELAGGFKEKIPINKQVFPVGQASSVIMPLTALRKLGVRATLGSVQPLDDGSGPFQWFAFQEKVPSSGATLFGLSERQCASVSAQMPAQSRGFFVGEGPYYIGATLNDYNLQGAGNNEGTLYNLEATAAGVSWPDSARVTVPPGAYQHQFDVTFSLVVPLTPGAPPPASYTCP